MHLIYFDETGNSGKNLLDPQQPIFVLAALIVPEEKWQAIETELEDAIRAEVGDLVPPGHEIHATDLRNGTGLFRQQPVPRRLALRDRWLRIAAAHDLKLVYRAIAKRRFGDWLSAEFPAGVAMDPHVVAFPLLAQTVNEHLCKLPGSPLGIFISDEKKEIIGDVEKTIRLLRLSPGILRLTQIVEKGFFADSRTSRFLQLCDLCAFQARKKEEIKAGFRAAPIDAGGIKLIEPLLVHGGESLPAVLRWFVEQNNGATGQKKERPGENPGSTKGSATLVAAQENAQSHAQGKPAQPGRLRKGRTPPGKPKARPST